jgi:hypothetical protein
MTSEAALKGAVEALDGASYIPESILVTGGAGEFCVEFGLQNVTIRRSLLIEYTSLIAIHLRFPFCSHRIHRVSCRDYVMSKVSAVQDCRL